MKQKITIMKQRLDLSDEEINSYMDFGSLRRKQMAFETRKRNRYTILKWSVPTLLIISSAIWFFSTDDDSGKVSNTELAVEAEPNPLAQSVQPLTLGNDSAKLENEIEEDNASNNNVVRKQLAKPLQEEIPIREETVKSIENTQVESIYVQAEPINGYASLYTYLNANLQYPTESLKDSIQGIQTVSFIINIEGKPEKIQFGESLGIPFENEAKRLIENMPAWKPATFNGKPVSSKLALPLTFQIKKIKVKE
jgi:outer membrane biosynthesis protein TonB